MRKLKTHRFTGFIRLTSGTRIGGASESVGIGAIDLTYIRNPVDGKPYLPGSSLKGRLRTVLEERIGRFARVMKSDDKKPPGKQNEEYKDQSNGNPCGCAAPGCFVCRLFGPHFNLQHSLGPSRLLVKDSPFVRGPDSSDPQRVDAEIKAESVNNRDTGSAQHPRLQERVPPGCLFRFSVSLDVWGEVSDRENPEEEPGSASYGGADPGWASFKAFLLDGLALLQSAGIGSSVRRGSGQFEFLASLDAEPNTLAVDDITVTLPSFEEAESRLANVKAPTPCRK